KPIITIHKAIKTSRVKIPACTTKSAFEANLRANANSKNPKTTFTELSQPPDFGKEVNQPGKTANKPNGKAKARENTNLPQNGPNILPPLAACTKSVPMIGPVQENETNANVNAIKKMPINPPLSDFASILLTNELGNTISNAPRKEAAKTKSKAKNARLNHTLVDKECNAPAPKISVTPSPKPTYRVIKNMA